MESSQNIYHLEGSSSEGGGQGCQGEEEEPRAPLPLRLVVRVFCWRANQSSTKKMKRRGATQKQQRQHDVDGGRRYSLQCSAAAAAAGKKDIRVTTQ